MTNKALMELYRAEHGIASDVELFTYGAWKKRGYMVKKGEKSEHKVSLWKYSEKKIVDEEGNETKSGRCFGKTMSLFTREQVEPLN